MGWLKKKVLPTFKEENGFTRNFYEDLYALKYPCIQLSDKCEITKLDKVITPNKDKIIYYNSYSFLGRVYNLCRILVKNTIINKDFKKDERFKHISFDKLIRKKLSESFNNVTLIDFENQLQAFHLFIEIITDYYQTNIVYTNIITLYYSLVESFYLQGLEGFKDLILIDNEYINCNALNNSFNDYVRKYSISLFFMPTKVCYDNSNTVKQKVYNAELVNMKNYVDYKEKFTESVLETLEHIELLSSLYFRVDKLNSQIRFAKYTNGTNVYFINEEDNVDDVFVNVYKLKDNKLLKVKKAKRNKLIIYNATLQAYSENIKYFNKENIYLKDTYKLLLKAIEAFSN